MSFLSQVPFLRLLSLRAMKALLNGQGFRVAAAMHVWLLCFPPWQRGSPYLAQGSPFFAARKMEANDTDGRLDF